MTTAGAPAPAWKWGWGGDGFDVAHDGQNATQAYGRSNKTILRSTTDGDSYGGISPPWPASQADVYLAAVATDPSWAGGVYASSRINLWQSRDGGATWPKKASIPGAATHVDVAAANGNNVAVAVCGGPEFLKIEVSNVGVADLVISSVQRLMGSTDFRVLPNPATPLSLAPGEDIGFTVAFKPTGALGLEAATIRIITNDPGAPVVDLLATGWRGTARLATAIAHAGDFGPVCLGSIRDEALTLNNTGTCRLLVSDITSLSPDFLVPSAASYPLAIDPGDSLEVRLRFAPTALGWRSGTVQLFSNDPAGPRSLEVSGLAPPPRLALVMADSGSFGRCCVGSFKDEPLILSTSGRCTLTVTGISSSSGEFVVPEVLSYPLTVEPGNSLEVPVRFRPASLGAKTATITVTSDDPANPHTIDVSGDAPPGKLAVTGSTYFGGVKCGRWAFRTIAVCNTGDCDLHVSKVAFERKSRHWALVRNPFPATLHPGSCLNVTIRYKATQSEPRPCELVITSDDPVTPVREVEVIAWTRCCCRECCDACPDQRDCAERHQERCEEHNRECCEEREEQGVARREDRRHEPRGHRAKRHDEFEDEE